jgi:2-iminobutanoate/2-iminopropanoate deaminase
MCSVFGLSCLEEKEMRMKCQAIVTDKAPAAIGPYSQAIKAGSWVFVSGQLGLKPGTGDLVGDGFPEQSSQALENLRQILTAAGCGLQDVVSVDVFITDMGQFAVFNRIYETFFAGHKPARAVVEVGVLPKGCSVEVKCIAIRHE